MMHLFTTAYSSFFHIFGALGKDCAHSGLFGLRPWYYYLNVDGVPSCNVVMDSTQLIGPQSPVLLVLLAIVDDLLRIAGLVAVVFVMYGGFTYITSQGSPDKTAEAQKTILNAVIGLVISLIAVALVAFIGAKVG